TVSEFLVGLATEQGLAPTRLICPLDTRLPARAMEFVTRSNISYFIAAHIDELAPKKVVCGDRNIAVPPENPKLPFADGVVRWLTIPKIHTNSGWVVLSDVSILWTTNMTRLGDETRQQTSRSEFFIP